jgi:hypothetical protein
MQWEHKCPGLRNNPAMKVTATRPSKTTDVLRFLLANL